MKYISVIVLALLLGGCQSTAYYWQAGTGHWRVLRAAQDIQTVLDEKKAEPQVLEKLAHVQDIRRFSIEVLGLPDNASYTRYADLKRPFVVWNVLAAPVDSLELKTWCFPFMGCISYKGFYSEEAARALGEALRQEGFEVAVSGVPAYSTLGWTADPVLNTFIHFPVGELARLIFHELAHQVLYIADDTQFNESFATAVEILGVDAWLAQADNRQFETQYREFDAKRVAFRRLLADARADLQLIFDNEANLAPAAVEQAKVARFGQLSRDYSALKIQWNGWAGFDRFMLEDLNNAKLAAVGLYDDYVPGFLALAKACGGDFARFYEAARNLGNLDREARTDFLLNPLSRPKGFKDCDGEARQ